MRVLSLVLISMFLSGCALNRQGAHEIGEMLARYERQRTREAAVYGRAPQGTPASQPAHEPAGEPLSTGRGSEQKDSSGIVEESSLAGLLAVALARNPDIQAAIETARSKASRIPQATALTDPILSTKTLPEPTRTAEGDNYFILGLKQTFPVPEKLDRRGRVALEEMHMAMEMLRQIKLRVIADVKRAYYRIYAIDKTVVITEENQRILRDLIEVARGQFQVGRRQQADVLRAQVEYANLENKLIELRQQRTTIVSLLNVLLNRSYKTQVATPPDYDVRRVDLHIQKLLAHAFRENPQLSRLRQQVARDEQAVQLAMLSYWPDFTLGFEWMQMDPRGAFKPQINRQTGLRPRSPQISEDGSDNWAITFSFNIPIWFERIKAQIREAEQKLAASRREHVSTRNTVSFKVQDAMARVQSLREIADLYATSIIPQAQQAYDVSRSGYIAGSSDFQYVIDNWQKWLFFRIEYNRTLGELERSVADLEQAVGISIVEVESDGGS